MNILFIIIIGVLVGIIFYLLSRPPEKKFVYPEEISIKGFIEESLRMLNTRSYLLYRITDGKISLETIHGCPPPDFIPDLECPDPKEERYLKKSDFKYARRVIFRGERRGYLVIFLLNSKVKNDFKVCFL